MNKYLLPVAIVSMAASAMVGAQTPSTSSSSTDSSAPSSSMQSPPSSGSTSNSSQYSSSSTTTTETKSQMKDCIAKQKASNSQLTDSEAKRACDKSSSGN